MKNSPKQVEKSYFSKLSTLAYDNVREKRDAPLPLMTKLEVLELFARTNGFLAPDRVWLGLQRRLDRRSVYSYLLRLKRQGLLETGANVKRGHLAYRLTQRGLTRLQYLRTR